MAELWKIVAACPAYEVSSLGRVRRRLPGKRTRVGNLLSIRADVRYRTVTLVQHGVRKIIPVHRLVCETFHGPRPSPLHQVAHLNGDRHDNRANNLMWATAVENAAHKEAHGTRIRGVEIYGAKLSENDVLVIRARFARGGVTFTALGREYGVNYTTIRRAIQGDNWKHVEAAA